ncbi:MAG: helix-hairpin-helix domain-containing protein [Salinivenus sp.]
MPRRPGITFKSVTPSPSETLPRMDVAAFVGFATRGPIDVPVPVEDRTRFRDVFGPPLELVRDREAGRTKTAHLHRAVEAFFRNGGRRCWVVRVAQAKNAGASSGPVERASFGLPGLVSAETEQRSTVRARCFGATFDDLRVGTVLRRRLLSDPTTGARGEGEGASEALTLSWAARSDTPLEDNSVVVGDLLRVVVKGGDVVYAPVAEQTRIEPRATAEVPGGGLEIRAAPTYLFDAAQDPLSRVPAGGATSVDLQAQSLNERFSNRPLPAVESVERLLFDLLVWEEQGLQTRLDRLGFTTSHPRAWTDLPVDADLFGRHENEALTPAPDTLAADVFEPRFPLASPEGPGEGPFLPFGMADRPDPNRTGRRLWSGERASRLERERLSTFSTDVFVDSTLVGTSTANLAEKADDMMYVEQGSASGLHSLWPIREATLLALPDALHRGWDDPHPVTPDSLPPPSDLEMEVDRGATPPRIHLSWSVDRLGDEGVEVELQEAQTPTFENAVVRYRGAESSIDRYVRRDDPVTLFFRYRVVAAGQPEPWSNTRYTTLPTPDFDSCTDRPEAPHVSLHEPDGDDGGCWLRWPPVEHSTETRTGDIDLNTADLAQLDKLLYVGEWTARRIIEYRNARDDSITNPLQLAAVRGLTRQRIQTWRGQVAPPLPPHHLYEIQIDTTPTFASPKVVKGRSGEVGTEAEEGEVRFSMSTTPPGIEPAPDNSAALWYGLEHGTSVPAVRYVRMRAFHPGASRMHSSSWSRTIRVVQSIEQGTPCISKEEYDNPRQNTPGGGREGLLNVQRAMLRFAAARGDVLSVLVLPEQDQPDDARRHATRLRTLGATLDYGEERTLSYGALYYPWLLGSVGDRGQIAPMPPDGAACGMIADRTLRDGAWMAPANAPLADVPTVIPPFTADERTGLEAASINVFAETPDGVLTLDTATLARDPDLEPITTRRLLILVRRLVRREGPPLVFENNSPLLRRRIAEQLDGVLRRLFDRGAFAGATPAEGYRIVADESVNPPRQVERGHLVVELRIAPARPLKFLTVRLVQRSGQRPAVREPGPETPA